jgi:ATP-dependent protease ClpP protease subunit
MARKSTGLLVTTQRSVPVRGALTKRVSTACIARLLVLAAEDSESPVLANIQCPSGIVSEAIRVLSTINGIRCSVATFSLGRLGGAGTIIAAHGRKGFRVGSPGATFSFAFDPEPELHHDGDSYLKLLVETVAQDTSQHHETVLAWFKSGVEFTAAQALALGIIDSISAKSVLPEK